jgi:hypothetical protein
MEQATQIAFDGKTLLKRWRVELPTGQRVVTWAVDRADARAKVKRTRGVWPRSITPACGSLIDDRRQ